MGENNRQGVLLLRAHMDKVNADAIDLSTILRKTVDRLLSPTPVIPSTPIFDQCARLLQRHALGPVRNGLPVRPTRQVETTPEIVKNALWTVDGERGDANSAALTL